MKLQKKVMCMINLSKYNAHTDPILSIKFLKVSDILQIQILNFYYKLIHNKLPGYLQVT